VYRRKALFPDGWSALKNSVPQTGHPGQQPQKVRAEWRELAWMMQLVGPADPLGVGDETAAEAKWPAALGLGWIQWPVADQASRTAATEEKVAAVAAAAAHSNLKVAAAAAAGKRDPRPVCLPALGLRQIVRPERGPFAAGQQPGRSRAGGPNQPSVYMNRRLATDLPPVIVGEKAPDCAMAAAARPAQTGKEVATQVGGKQPAPGVFEPGIYQPAVEEWYLVVDAK
jgi:hypothetical protein